MQVVAELSRLKHVVHFVVGMFGQRTISGKLCVTSLALFTPLSDYIQAIKIR